MWNIVFVALSVSAAESPRHFYDEAQYADAIAGYDEMLERTDLNASERLEAQLYLGFSHLALRHEEAARRQFRAVLRSDPHYVLPTYAPPKFRMVFEDMRNQVTAAPSLALKSAEDTALAKLRFVFLMQGAREAHPILHWRRSGQTAFVALALDASSPGEASGEIARGDTTIEYYAQLEGAQGIVARVGSESQPLVFIVQPVPVVPPVIVVTPLYEKWWLWTAVGAVVAGGAATGIYFATRPSTPTGIVDLQLQGAR